MRALIVPNTDVISKEALITELETEGQGDISRSVTIVDKDTPEVIWVELESRDEFDILLNSPKVAGANSDAYEDKIRFEPQGSATINPEKTNSISASYHNWGLAQMTQDGTTLATTFSWQNTGANVDVVIMDTGIQLGHPEFNDLATNTSSRINQVNFGGTQGASFYTDPDGHGTHVASIMAGRTQGWARDATIHSFTSNIGSNTHGYNLSQMGYITSWHNGKSNGKPTVVNMSWATITYYPPNHPNHTINIPSWDPNNIPDSQYHMTRSSSYDTLVRNMVNAGIVVVCSAGNDNERIYATNETGTGEWNSGYWYFFDSANDMGYGANEKMYKEDATAHDPNVHGTGSRSGIAGPPPGGSYGNTIYFQPTNNGQSPSNAWLQEGTSTRHDIAVMSHNMYLSKSGFSNYGTPLRVWAPGTYIMGAYINKGSAVQIGATGYYVNKLSGTSMASPQVAGLIACYLDKDHSTYAGTTTKANQEAAIAFIEGDGDIDDGVGDWGSAPPNRNRAYQPYQEYNYTWNQGNGVGGTYSVATINEYSSTTQDLSATIRNKASEQLHTVSYSIQSGSLPSGLTLNNSTGVISGMPGPTTGGQTYTFVIRAENGFEYLDKSYSLTVNDNVINYEVTGGVIIDGGARFG